MKDTSAAASFSVHFLISLSSFILLAAHPSLAVTFFLHEAYGEERILKVLDYFQHPPWQFHHTESCGGTPVPPSGSCRSSSAVLLQPYLLPSRDFYSLSAGMPVWGVRPVHCGGEILRLTLYSGHDNYQDAVHFYQTVLQRDAEEQKTGFCWFTLLSGECPPPPSSDGAVGSPFLMVPPPPSFATEPGLCMQLAVKQLPPGVRVRPCTSAVLQFCVEEMGQLVALLPHPCSPISSTRWQTRDLDGNTVLFQVRAGAPPGWNPRNLFILIFERCDFSIMFCWSGGTTSYWSSRSILDQKISFSRQCSVIF